MTTVHRIGSTHTDGTHGVSAYLSDEQVRTLLRQAETAPAADDLARFYRAVLATRRAERQECGVSGHLAKCSCAAYEASQEGA